MIITRSRPKLDLLITARAGRSYVPFLKKMLRRAHEVMRSPLRELSVALVGEVQMSELHERFMGISGPTDVLSFPLEEDCGEIVICVPQAMAAAKQWGIAVEKELLLYAIHGMLHLSGMDDRTEPDFRAMHRLEDRILTELGIGAVFNPSQRQTRRPS
jgi:probable rRNA maturation factor